MARIFPANRFRIERKSQPLMMPSRTVKADPDSSSPWIAADTEFQRNDMYQGIRLMVLAVLNLFSGHRPTRGDDPGVGAARPLKMELLNAIAERRLTSRAFERRPADPEKFPYAAAA
jgi:hypothetical protein